MTSVFRIREWFAASEFQIGLSDFLGAKISQSMNDGEG